MAPSFFKELKRRNVFRVVIGYVVLAWLMAQVAELILETFGAPGWVMKSLLALFGIGLPFVVYFSWAFELTPEGVRREREVDRQQSNTRQTGRKLDRAIIVLLVLALAWFAWDRFQPGDMTTPVAPVAEHELTANARGVIGDVALPVVAVLPFKATGSDDGGFLAAGLHDDLLTRLSKLGAFRVISRTSMLEYANTTKNMRQIGEEVGAGYILEGGVQARGERVRINAQLIEASDDKHLWAEIYDRELTANDLFDVQSELALAIAEQMHTVLSPDDRAVMEQKPTDNIEAYNAYLRGLQKREVAGTFGEPQAIRDATDAFSEAVQLDPNFALAWAELSMAHSFAYQIDGTPENANAMAALTTAQGLEPKLLEVGLARSEYLYRVQHEYQEALDVLNALGKRVAGNAYGLQLRGWLYRRLGKFDEAYGSLRDASKLAPRNVGNLGNLVHFAIRAEDCKGAGQYAAQLLALEPESTATRSFAAMYELECTGNSMRAGELLRGLDFTTSSPEAWFLAWDTAFKLRDSDWAASLADNIPFSDGPMASIFKELDRATIARYLDGDAEAALKHLDAADKIFRGMEETGQIADTEVYASLKTWFFSLKGDAPATRRWVDEHKRRIREEYHGDLAGEALNHFDYSQDFAAAGLVDEAVAELRTMLEQPGGHRFPYVDGMPEFDVLQDHPGYIELRERFGGMPVQNTDKP